MKKCFLCSKTKNVLDFNKTSFKKCFSALMFRRKKKYKYWDILTVESTHGFGYHKECVKKVTVLKAKDKQEFEDFCKTLTIPWLPSNLDERSTSPINSDVEEPSAKINNKPTTVISDEQQSTTAMHEQPTTSSALEDNHSQSTSTSQYIMSTTTTNKKSACLFCGHVEKKVGNRRTYVIFPQSEATVQGIKAIAKKLKDNEILQRLEDNKPIAYHSVCLLTSQMSLKRQAEEHPQSTDWHKNRHLHQLAFNYLSGIIKTEIIAKSHVMYLTDLLCQYKSLILEFGEGQIRAEDLKDYRAENLEGKIFNAFGDRVTIELSMGTPKKKIVYLYDMDTARLAGEIAMLESTQKNRSRNVAYELRNSITSLQSTKLLDKNLTAEDIIRGECNIPEELFNFVCDLVQGPDIRRKNSDEDLVKIKSVCSDLIYMVSKGRIKPTKHLTLGISDFD